MDLPLLAYLEVSLNPPCSSRGFISTFDKVCHFFLTFSLLVRLKILLGHFGSQTAIVTGDCPSVLGSGGKVDRYWLKQELCVISPAAGAYEYCLLSCPVQSPACCTHAPLSVSSRLLSGRPRGNRCACTETHSWLCAKIVAMATICLLLSSGIRRRGVCVFVCKRCVLSLVFFLLAQIR